MFTDIDFELESNVEDIYVHCLNRLCSDSMTILQNNSKVLKYLTDKEFEQELKMLVASLNMSIKHSRFELVQNILSGLKDNIHKLAALEIKYFDEYETLVRTDIYNKFMPQTLKKHAFVPPALKEVFNILDETILLSPTNAAFAIKTAFDTKQYTVIDWIFSNSDINTEFVSQISKRFHANFGLSLKEILSGMNNNLYENKKEIRNFCAKAM